MPISLPNTPHRSAPADASNAPRTLYRVAGLAALLTVLITAVQVVVFILWPPPGFLPAPGHVTAWFALLQHNWFLGLIDLDFLMVLDYVLLLLVFLGFFVALRPANRSLMAIGTAFAFAGIAVYFTTNPALAMLALSNQYAAAAAGAERAALEAAGLAVLAGFQGTPGAVSYILMGLAGILVSIVMLRSGVFGKATACLGLLQGALMLIPSTAGPIGLVFSLASLVPFTIWFILVGRRSQASIIANGEST